MDKTTYGKFHTGDSYIVLHVSTGLNLFSSLAVARPCPGVKVVSMRATTVNDCCARHVDKRGPYLAACLLLCYL